ncbi:MAG TPA: hypothetical protein VG476_16050, partial [Acidimicrobiales bacterium]|nr:hypothetical protein [Acidimicrobiales bacterium]
MSDVSQASDVAAAEAERRAKLEAAGTVEALRTVEAEVVGRRSRLATLQQGLAGLPPDERRSRGRQLNEARARLQAALDLRRADLEGAERRRRLEAERLDLTETLPVPG